MRGTVVRGSAVGGLLALGMAMLLAVAPAAAGAISGVSTGTGVISGHVRDAEGHPVAGVRVELMLITNPFAISGAATTAPDGSYRVSDLPPDRWQVRARTTLGPTGPAVSPVPTYWSPQGSTERSAAAGTLELGPGDVAEGVDLVVRRTGAELVSLYYTKVLTGPGVELSTLEVVALGHSGVPSGVVQLTSPIGYVYGDVRLDASGRARLPFSMSQPATLDLTLGYTGDAVYAPASRTLYWSSFSPYPPTSGVVASEPWRLIDGDLVPGAPSCRKIAGRVTIPADAAGAIVNVTAVDPHGPGYAVLYPDSAGTHATAPPAAGATVNFEPGQHVSNAAIVALSPEGYLCWASPPQAAFTRIVIDVTGYVAADAGFALQAHQRILDTRASGALKPRTLTPVQVTGHGGVPAGATAVLLNVAVTGVRSVGHLRLQPGALGEAVTTHYVPGADKSVATVATLSESGALTMWSETSSDVHAVLDVVGWVAGSDVYHPLDTPTRILDSRPGAPADLRRVAGPLVANAVYSLPVAGVGPVPAGATGAVLSVTAIGPSNVGNLSLYPDTEGTGTTPRPNASNINYVVGRNIPNLVVVELPSNGQINLVSQMPPAGRADVAIDLIGYITD